MVPSWCITEDGYTTFRLGHSPCIARWLSIFVTVITITQLGLTLTLTLNWDRYFCVQIVWSVWRTSRANVRIAQNVTVKMKSIYTRKFKMHQNSTTFTSADLQISLKSFWHSQTRCFGWELFRSDKGRKEGMGRPVKTTVTALRIHVLYRCVRKSRSDWIYYRTRLGKRRYPPLSKNDALV